MFEFFRGIPIKNKLILVVFSSAIFATVIGFSFFMYLHIEGVREDAVERVHSEMGVMAQDFVKIVTFSEAYLAADVVAKLRLFHSLKNIFLYNPEGRQVFRYENSPSSAMAPPRITSMPGLGETQAFFGDGFFQVLIPINYADGEYGWVFARVSTEEQDNKLVEYYQKIALAIPVMLLVSYLLAFWFQGYLSMPIILLAERVSRIADNQDFDERISSNDSNEIGSLCRSIGQLLDAIRYSQQRLHQSEARLEAIISIAGSALISIDENNRITLFNRQAEYIFGYAARDVIGQHLNMLLPERFREEYAQKVTGFSESEDSLTVADLYRTDVRGRRKSGEEFPVEASISQMMLEDQKIFTVALTDVSQRRQTEAELETYRSHLEDVVSERTVELLAKNRELEAFSYSVAHDLRAPLRSITSFSQILREDAADKLDKKELDILNRIVRGGQRMSELIDGILNLARIGRTPLSIAEVDLSAIVQKIQSRLGVEQPARDVQWRIAQGITARGDRQLLGIVVENLISNAWKYSRKKSQAVIEFGVVDQRGKRAYFVKDNGAGFDMKHADKLFGVFHRLHSVEDYEGTGVGLATVQRIVHRHGGSIWAEAIVDEGATFYFTLQE